MKRVDSTTLKNHLQPKHRLQMGPFSAQKGQFLCFVLMAASTMVIIQFSNIL